ncbi:MAG: hypothetical protein NC126_05180 [Clostridium sp.]|nr:hypothetical protein [Clostridium sp.]
MLKSKNAGLKLLLILFSILASVKMLFVGFGLDEEYQLVMAYRNAMGDKLFLDMWEPHQSSAFLCTLLLKPYLMLFGTTGTVLYLRAWGTLLHLGVSVYLCHVLRNMIDREYAWLLGLIYFNTIPKQMILPEFGIMQVWFYTLLSLFLIQYYQNGRKMRYLVFASLALMLNVLSYPSCLILYPFVLIWIACLSGKDKWRDMGIVTFLCILGGVGYLGMLLSYAPPGTLFSTISLILNGDATHTLSLGNKLWSVLTGSLYVAGLWAGCFAASTIIGKLKHWDFQKIFFLTCMSSCAVELFYWIVLDSGYETMQLHLPVLAAMGFFSYQNASDSLSGEKLLCARLLKFGMLGAILCLLAVVYLTDLSFIPSIPHAMPAAFYGITLSLLPLQSILPNRFTLSQFPNGIKKDSARISALLIVWCLTAIIGKGYTMRGNMQYNNVLQSRGILKHGPAAGCVSNYMGAYIYNNDYEDWQTYLKDGDKVLIVIKQVMNPGTVQYLFKDVEISHFSIINPTVYDERLLEYWEMYPHKKPNVIIVDCWYGQLLEDPDSWIMQYIENDFAYTQVNDGSYIRIYRR